MVNGNYLRPSHSSHLFLQTYPINCLWVPKTSPLMLQAEATPYQGRAEGSNLTGKLASVGRSGLLLANQRLCCRSNRREPKYPSMSITFGGTSVAHFVRHFEHFEENEDFDKRHKCLYSSELPTKVRFLISALAGLTWWGSEVRVLYRPPAFARSATSPLIFTHFTNCHLLFVTRASYGFVTVTSSSCAFPTNHFWT